MQSENVSLIPCRVLTASTFRFAITVCPVYEEENDRVNSPFDLANTTPFSWSWLSTINRVNSQVQKVRGTSRPGRQYKRLTIL